MHNRKQPSGPLFGVIFLFYFSVAEVSFFILKEARSDESHLPYIEHLYTRQLYRAFVLQLLHPALQQFSVYHLNFISGQICHTPPFALSFSL
jgi:hypothetical protein